MGQTLLFPDPKPLDQRLGRKFFRKAPRRPGVHVMKDASDKVLHLGKAKDLNSLPGAARSSNRTLTRLKRLNRIGVAVI